MLPMSETLKMARFSRQKFEFKFPPFFKLFFPPFLGLGWHRASGGVQGRSPWVVSTMFREAQT